MLYAFYALDAPDQMALRLQHRDAHRQRLAELQNQGRLVLAGPFTPTTDAAIAGSLIVAEFADEHAARSWLANDPYQQAGVYQSVAIQPFLQVLP